MTGIDVQVAFITGRSRPGISALSDQQAAFIGQLAAYARVCPVNFPWHPPGEDYRKTGLLRASINNARDYLGARQPAFTQRYQQPAIQLIASAEYTLLLSGSCGLELFNHLQLPASLLSRVGIFAFGPVARKRPDCRHVLVQGQRDWISRLWFPQVDHGVSCGHMDYLVQPELLGLCLQFLNTFPQRRE